LSPKPRVRRAAPHRAAQTAPQPTTHPGDEQPIVHLLDGNVLVALTDASHVHHAAARRWFAASAAPFATCPVTQGTLLRVQLRLGAARSIADALALLAVLTAHSRHRFWPDAIGYDTIRTSGLQGHRQVTDAYLAALARHHGGRLATFDQGLAALHDDVAALLA
jgi:toxin-antitoxin system PIN domain toxin